jgi:hypothetical protein
MEEYNVGLTLDVQEALRPHRQYKEDVRKDNKPAGHKQVHDQKAAKCTNWFSPFLWTQIEVAARCAGKPWSPCVIAREAKKSDPKVFGRLMEQVVGRWIDPIAKAEGLSKWKESVLIQVVKGNSPHGHNTRVGILVCLFFFATLIAIDQILYQMAYPASALRSSLGTAQKPRLDRTKTAKDRKIERPQKTETAVRSAVHGHFKK